jgi:hypothetical protein
MSTDRAGMGRGLCLGQRRSGLRSVNGPLWRSGSHDSPHPLVRAPVCPLGSVRPVHCCQLLADVHHPCGAHHPGEVHQCLWTAVVGARRGQPGRAPPRRLDLRDPNQENISLVHCYVGQNVVVLSYQPHCTLI